MKKLIILLFILTSSIVFAQEDTMIFKVYGVAPTDTYEQMEYPYYDAESNSYRAYLISVDNNYYTTAYLSEGEMNFAIHNNGILVFSIVVDEEYGNYKIDRRGAFIFPFPTTRRLTAPGAIPGQGSP
jgi:hypothetical protein